MDIIDSSQPAVESESKKSRFEATLEANRTGEYRCCECPRGFTSITGVSMHFRLTHALPRYSCIVSGCGERYHCWTPFKKHCREVHGIHHLVGRRHPIVNNRFREESVSGSSAAHNDTRIDELPLPAEADFDTEIADDGTIFLIEKEISDSNDFSIDLEESGPTPEHMKMAIGFVMNSAASAQGTRNTEEDDAELLALDESERPNDEDLGDGEDAAGNFFDQSDGVVYFQWLLKQLKMHTLVKPEELLDLWTTFLTYQQRVHFLNQIDNVGVDVLRVSGMGALIEAWAGFRSLLLEIGHHEQVATNGTKPAAEIIGIILTHCIVLERVRDNALPRALAAGQPIPDLLRVPSTIPDLEAPLIYLLSALEDRAKCRKLHPEWVVLTKIMVLEEFCGYVRELKQVVKALYSGPEEVETLERIFGTSW